MFLKVPLDKEFDNRGGTPVAHIDIGFRSGETSQQKKTDTTVAQELGETMVSTYGVIEHQITIVSVENGAGTDSTDFRLQVGKLCPSPGLQSLD